MKPSFELEDKFMPKVKCLSQEILVMRRSPILEMKGHVGQTVHLDVQSGEFPGNKIIR